MELFIGPAFCSSVHVRVLDQGQTEAYAHIYKLLTQNQQGLSSHMTQCEILFSIWSPFT